MDLSLYNWPLVGTMVLLIGGEANILLALFSKTESVWLRRVRGVCGTLMLSYGVYLVAPFVLAHL